MRIISKKISYDNLVSRLPGIIPSIVDSWTIPSLYNCGINGNEETFYNYNSAVKRASEYNINASSLKYEAQFINFDKNNLIEFTVGNYGLIPSDVIIPQEISNSITDYTDIYVNIPDENGGFYDLSWPKNASDPHYEGRKIISGGTEIKILTYYTLNKWYSFFKEYYELIGRPTFSTFYNSAIDYYNKEITVKNEDKYNYYKSLDDTFNARGGDEMYNWISDNCIIQYQIPSEFVDNWNTTFLYYSDAIKWYNWFKEREEKYKTVVNLEDCISDNIDCCDCSEFVKLGGQKFLKKLEDWVNGININPSFATNSASITIPVSFTNSIDDLGEMSIFSSVWKEERDYHNTLEENGYELLPNVNHGTIIDRPYEKYCKCKYCGYEGKEEEFMISNECPICRNTAYTVYNVTMYDTYTIKNGGNYKGSEYNSYFENVFKENNWSNYTDYYINTHPEEFLHEWAVTQNGNKEAITSYTYSPINGKVIYNPDDIFEIYKINKKQVVCINGDTYDVINGKYVELCYATNSIANIKYKKKEKLQVLKDGDIEYVVFNGKRKYVETDPNNPEIEKVYFLKESNCYDEGCQVSEGEYVIFDGCLYIVSNNSITIDNGDSYAVYPVLNGYFDINDNRYYTSGYNVVIQNSYEYDDDSNTYFYKFRNVSGSGVKEFGIKSFFIYDDKENVKISYIFSEINCQKISGHTDSKLDLLRRKKVTTDDLGNELPGHFKDIVDVNKGTNQSKYNLPYDECTLDILYKVGEVSNLIPIGDNKYIGNIITDIIFYYVDEFGYKIPNLIRRAENDDALAQIDDLKLGYEDYIESFPEKTVQNTIMCDITYHFGAYIEKDEDHYSIITDNDIHGGVKYVDTVYVEKRVGNYYLNNGKQFTFNYYSLSQNVNTIELTDFNTNVVRDASTYFEMNILLYFDNDGIIEYNDYEFSGFSKNNNIMAAPLMRTEFNLSSSMPQNIDADIYIDRGINASFEKHLKLQEFRTMDALENYGNGWFKINEY